MNRVRNEMIINIQDRDREYQENWNHSNKIRTRSFWLFFYQSTAFSSIVFGFNSCCFHFSSANAPFSRSFNNFNRKNVTVNSILLIKIWSIFIFKKLYAVEDLQVELYVLQPKYQYEHQYYVKQWIEQKTTLDAVHMRVLLSLLDVTKILWVSPRVRRQKPHLKSVTWTHTSNSECQITIITYV